MVNIIAAMAIPEIDQCHGCFINSIIYNISFRAIIFSKFFVNVTCFFLFFNDSRSRLINCISNLS
jgi:hypothetical protein